MGIGALAAFGVGVLAVGIPAAAMWVRRAVRGRRRHEAEALARGRILRVDDKVIFRGTTGDGPRLAGMGCLVLTDRELRFVQWWPHETLTVPRERITRVDTASSHLGRSFQRPLLRVTSADGVCCWEVREIDGWTRLFEPGAPPGRAYVSRPPPPL